MFFIHAWPILSLWIVTAEMEIVYFVLRSDGMQLSDYIAVLNNKNKFENTAR